MVRNVQLSQLRIGHLEEIHAVEAIDETVDTKGEKNLITQRHTKVLQKGAMKTKLVLRQFQNFQLKRATYCQGGDLLPKYGPISF